MDQTELTRRVDLVARFGRELHESGAPSDRLEVALVTLAQALELQGQFFSTPTSIMMSLRHGHAVETRLERLEPGVLDLEKLANLDDLLAGALDHATPDATLASGLDRMDAAPPRYGPAAHVLGNALVTSSAAFIFGGGLREVALAATLGVMIAAIERLGTRLDASNRLSELLASSLVSFVATSAASLMALQPTAVALGSLIPLLPGLNLTVAIKEIATRHLVSGTARFGGTLIVFLTLGFGSALGGQLATSWFGPPSPSVPPLVGFWAYAPALLATGLGLAVLFRAQPRDYPWIVFGATLALTSSRFFVPSLGTALGSWATAFAVGLAGNLFARIWKRSASVIHVPGLILLVPGALTHQSISAINQKETLVGLETAFSVATIGIGLTMGLLLATALVPPRRPV